MRARETKTERHGRFVASLGDRIIWRSTDGGPGKGRDKHKAKAAKLARRRQRRTA
jgi:hypothetical protein